MGKSLVSCFFLRHSVLGMYVLRNTHARFHGIVFHTYKGSCAEFPGWLHSSQDALVFEQFFE